MDDSFKLLNLNDSEILFFFDIRKIKVVKKLQDDLILQNLQDWEVMAFFKIIRWDVIILHRQSFVFGI